jgi:hypothetical protein
MTEYDDPQLDEVRGWYIDGRRVHNPFASDAALVARFDSWLVEHDREIREEERKRCADIAQSFERDAVQYRTDLRAGISIDWLEGADDAARAIAAAILEDGIK